MSWNFVCPLQKENYNYKTYTSIHDLPRDIWDNVLKDNNIYLSLDYLLSIEESMSNEISFKYSLYYNKEKPVAISYIQLVKFTDDQDKYKESLMGLKCNFKSKLLSKLNLRALVCGNMYNCGENGFYHTDEIEPKDAFKLLSMNLFKIRNDAKESISLVLVKEFWSNPKNTSDVLKNHHFNDFKIDVNMVLPIHKDWIDYQAYLDSMTTKFRTKSKSVYKKSSALISKEFDVEDIKKHKDRIAVLFENVLERAEFQFGHLKSNSFQLLKDKLGSNYTFKGYFLEDKLVGFSTVIFDKKIMDANFVGIDYEYNNKHAIYQRILYDFVKVAISTKSQELRLGRTAEEIKSCTGAQPMHLKLYIRHSSLLQNKLIKPLIKSISPREFNIRKPFKVDFQLT